MSEKHIPPTNEEVQAELARLIDLAPRIRQRDAFGGDNRAKINAQILVLKGTHDSDYFYPEDEEDNEFYDEEFEVYMAAQDAEDWLDGVGEGLADGWEPLVVA